MSNASVKVSKELRALASELEDRVEAIAGQRMAFALLIFSPNEGERMNYISNGPREEMHQAMKALIKGWEEGMPDVPAHKMDS